jgi:hypothetical protein
MAVTFLSTPEDVTPGSASSWTNVDSTNVPSTAKGVILRVTHFDSTTSYGFGARMNNSTDTRQEDVAAAGAGSRAGHYFFIGVDGTSQIFEVWVENTTVLTVELMGYFEDEAFFKENGVDITPGSAGSYVDVDITAQAEGGDDPTAAILSLQDTSAAPNSIFCRENTSTDDEYDDTHHNIGYIVGVDVNDIFECKIESATENNVWLVGYLTSDLTWRTNGTSLTLSTTWADRTFDASAIAGMIIAPRRTVRAFGMRKNGSSEDLIYDPKDYCMFIAECDGSGIAEHKIESTSAAKALDVGYFTSGGGATTLTKTTTLDALLQKQGVTKTATLDARLQKQGITKTATLDGLLQSQGITKTVTLDALLKIFNDTKTVTLDSLLQKLGVTKTTTLDGVLVAQVQLTATLDALLQKIGDTKTAVLDARLEKQGVTITTACDGILQKINIPLTATLDALLQKVVSRSVTLDGVLQKLSDTKTVTLDAVLVDAAPSSFPIYIPTYRRRRR